MKTEIKQRWEDIQNGIVSDGYKETKIGIIPIEWEITQFKDEISLVSGQHIEAGKYYEVMRGIPYLTGPSDFPEDKIIRTKYTDEPKAICSKGDILITVKGSGVGKVVISDDIYCISRQLMAINSKSFNMKFIYYILKSREQFYNSESAGLIPGISRSDILITRIYKPLYQEQTRIAKILSTWDKAIELKAKLIEQKKLQKKGLMQQLLTGKKRVINPETGKEFSGEWEEVKLKELFTERKEIGFNDLQLLSIGEQGVYPQTGSNKRDTSNSDKSKYKKICPNDIGYNTMRMWQGRNALSQLEGIVSPAYTIVTPKTNTLSKYFSYLFKTKKVIHLFFRNSQGLVSDTLNCKFKDFKIVKVLVPLNFNEQEAISKVINTADKEINFLNQQLEQLQEHKKGMMQLLLTGIVRV